MLNSGVVLLNPRYFHAHTSKILKSNFKFRMLFFTDMPFGQAFFVLSHPNKSLRSMLGLTIDKLSELQST